MKFCSRLGFLVLALVCISKGDEGTDNGTQELQTGNASEPLLIATASTPTDSLNETRREDTHPTPSSPSSQDNTSATEMPDEEYFTTADTSTNDTTGESGGDPAPRVTTTPGITTEDGDAVVPTATTGASSRTDETKGGSSWGYVILVLIVVIVIALCIILFLLRRASKMYSFDLQRPSPAHNLSEPTGTFEPVYLDDLDRPAPKDRVNADEPSTPPTANGTTLQVEEKRSNGDAPQEQPHANGLQAAPTGPTGPSPDSDAEDRTSDQLGSPELFFDTREERHNENNNNPSICSSDPFVEINLEEPPWSDQLLSSPQAPSSVLPFSPFSFSSSS